MQLSELRFLYFFFLVNWLYLFTFAFWRLCFDLCLLWGSLIILKSYFLLRKFAICQGFICYCALRLKNINRIDKTIAIIFYFLFLMLDALGWCFYFKYFKYFSFLLLFLLFFLVKCFVYFLIIFKGLLWRLTSFFNR